MRPNKTILCFSLFCFLLSKAWAIDIITAQQPEDVRRLGKVTSKLELRKEPLLSVSPSILSSGAVVEIIGEETRDGVTWLKARTPSGQEGWFPANTPGIVIVTATLPSVQPGEGSKLATMSAGNTAIEQKTPDSSRSKFSDDKSRRIDIDYNDMPVSVPASKSELNVIRVPYPIKYVYTSRNYKKDDIGKAEYEVTIPMLKDINTDVAILTTEKTFVLSLVPTAKLSTFINIRDVGIRVTRGESREKDFPYVELLADLIKQVINGSSIEGYVSLQTSKTLETSDAIFILKKEITGVKYKIVVIDVINKTNEVLQIREDMKDVHSVIKNLSGKPLAVSITREFLQPKDREDKKGEFISTIYSVVNTF